MRDFARSDCAAVQTQLDRLDALSLPQGRLGLDVVRQLLARLGNPHQRLPPVFHVAGTNGKGSTVAFLRAMLEADGKRVHVTTSPHLVRYNERIRVAGTLVSDDRLAELLGHVLDAAEGLGPSFFEVTVAAAFVEFARVPADACLVEVGLGGRFDATNVIARPAVCGIAALGIDHERFLLAPEAGTPDDPLARIAFEKAGIAKPGVPLVTLVQPAIAAAAIREVAARVDAQLFEAVGELPEGIRLGLPGAHQAENAALALAMLRHQSTVSVSPEAQKTGLESAKWPARMQRLAPGPLTGSREVWLDGGHNCSAGLAIARHFEGQSLHLVIGMLDAKDPGALVEPLADALRSISAVPVPGHDWHPAAAFGPRAKPAPDVASVLTALPNDGLPVLIAGSLYLAGEVLRLNNELPD